MDVEIISAGGERSALDDLLALGGVLELLAGDLVEQVGQAGLDDVVGDLLPLAAGRRARRTFHGRCRQRVERRYVAQHAH